MNPYITLKYLLTYVNMGETYKIKGMSNHLRLKTKFEFPPLLFPSGTMSSYNLIVVFNFKET